VSPESLAWATRSSDVGFQDADLKPGDQVWFKNPYYSQGLPWVYDYAYAKYIAQGKTPQQADAQAKADASAAEAGDQGSNVFYLGVGTPNMKDSFGHDAYDYVNKRGIGLVMSIYNRKVYTISAYQQHIIDDFDTIQAYQWHFGNNVPSGDFEIKRIRSVLDPSAL
jgi:hypothetical protein